jgi:hypothetical protein
VTPHIDADEVRDALRANPAAVLDAYGWRYRRVGARLKSSACPARADHSRPDAFSMSATDGRWQCFSCCTGDDVIGFIAGAERLDARRDFAAVLARAAEIAGVGPATITDDERRARREASARARAAAEAKERADRAARERAAIPKATAHWAALAHDDERGAAYLAGRGLAGAARLTRFDLRLGGSPAVPLFTSRGEIRNVVRRALPAWLETLPEDRRDMKAPGLRGCPTAGTLLAPVTAIAAGRLAVVAEGVADTLTAAIAFPGAVPLGAHGIGNLSDVVAVAARRCADVGATLAIVPQNDAPGIRGYEEAVERAVAAGLSMRIGTLRIVRPPRAAKDLNEAWCNGWRPAA